MRFIKAILFASIVLITCTQSFAYNPREKMWRAEIDKFIAQDSIFKPASGQILFVGSSSIRMWHELASYFPDFDIIQRGVGGSHLEDIIYFAEQIVFAYEPRQIVLYEGDNDLKDGFTPESYLDEVRTFVRLVQIKQPKTPIVILSIKPSPQRNYLLSVYRTANELLRLYAEVEPLVTFVDITPTVIDSKGNYTESAFLSDELHICRATYQNWGNLIRPYLLKH
ncbi:MAG: hypothetical protein RR410_03630 [Alistipes sp.]